MTHSTSADFQPRLASLRKFLAERKLDALVCRLNQNVLMLSGYCPMNGLSLAVLPREGEPVLLIPKQDERFARDTWVADVRTYPWGDTRHLDPLASLLPLLAAVAVDHKLSGKRVGVELEYPIASLPVWAAEIRQWTGAALQRMKGALSAGEWVDVWADLNVVASRKTPWELDRIRAANRLGGLALETFRANAVPGRRECAIAAAVEHAVQAEGPTKEGVKFARAWATVMSGPNTQYAGQTYNVSTDRVVEDGDLVSIELGLVADGFWTDLTRVHVAGKAKPARDEAYRKLHGEVVRAHDAAAAAIRPGGKWSDVDHAAR